MATGEQHVITGREVYVVIEVTEAGDIWVVNYKGLFHGQKSAWTLLRELRDAGDAGNKYYITKLLAITGETEDLEPLDFTA